MLLADLPGESGGKLLFPIYRSLALTPAKRIIFEPGGHHFAMLMFHLLFHVPLIAYTRKRLNIITTAKTSDCLQNVLRRVDSSATVPEGIRI